MIQDFQRISDLCHHFFEHPSSRGQPSSVNDITTTAIDIAAHSCDNNEKGITVVMANCEFQTGGVHKWTINRNASWIGKIGKVCQARRSHV
jgi:hypothetical protein